MAERYWDGGTSTDPTNVNNWSDTDGGGTPASSVPGEDDHAHFMASGDGNDCSLTAAWALTELTAEAGYTSRIDLVTFDLTVSGDVTLQHAGDFLQGTGNFSVGGNLNCVGVGSWNRYGATGTLTAIGTTEASWNLDDVAVGDLVIARGSGALDVVTFTGGWTAASYQHTSGTVFPNGQTMETTGNFSILPGATIVSGSDAWDSVALTVGGDFIARGSSAALLNLQATDFSEWTLALTGSGSADRVTVAENTVSSGLITATRSDNVTGNTIAGAAGWTFAPPLSGTSLGLAPGLASFPGVED